jgi:hypothetical protein
MEKHKARMQELNSILEADDINLKRLREICSQGIYTCSLYYEKLVDLVNAKLIVLTNLILKADVQAKEALVLLYGKYY